MPLAPSGLSSGTPTLGISSQVAVSYLSTGAARCIDIGFIPSFAQFWSGSLSWVWGPTLTFGQAIAGQIAGASNSWTAVTTAGVLDTVDGSGNASPNIATTTKAIGLVIGSNSVVNSAAGITYFGFALR